LGVVCCWRRDEFRLGAVFFDFLLDFFAVVLLWREELLGCWPRRQVVVVMMFVVMLKSLLLLLAS
jgi:hypothetical protein